MASVEELLEQVEDRRPALVELGLVVVGLAFFVNLLTDSLQLSLVWWHQVLLGLFGIVAVAGLMYWYSFNELFVTRATVELILPLLVTWSGHDQGVEVLVIPQYAYTHQAGQLWKHLLGLRRVSAQDLLKDWNRDETEPEKAGHPPEHVRHLLREFVMLVVLNEVFRFGVDVHTRGAQHGPHASLVRLLEDLQVRDVKVKATPPDVHKALAGAKGMQPDALHFRGPEGLRVEVEPRAKGLDAWHLSAAVGKSVIRIQVPRYWTDWGPRSTAWRVSARLFSDREKVEKRLSSNSASLRLARAELTLSVRIFSLYSLRKSLFKLHYSWLGSLLNHLRSVLDWQECVMKQEPLRLIAEIQRQVAELRQAVGQGGSSGGEPA
jgi:hypothetical protein